MIIKPKQLHVIFFLFCCLGFSSFSCIFNNKNHDSFFTKNNPYQRFPAKAQPANKDLKLLKDFFKPNTFGSLIDYQLTTKTYVGSSLTKQNETDLYFKNEIKKIISNTYIDQLNKKDKKSPPIKESIVDLVINHLLTKSKDDILKEESFQADLLFNPIVSKSFSFKKEMNTNQLINYSYKNNLQDFINSSAVSFEKNIYKALIPSNGSTYQYLGGVISVSTKKKEKNVKGIVRYRRYFRVNRLADLDMTIESRLFNLDVVHFKSHQFQKLPIITVDVLKEFNSKNSTQELKHLNIYFDNVTSSMSHYSDEKEASIRTADLYFKGNTPFANYKANIHSLSWSFETESFSSNSKMTIELIKPRFDMNYGEIKNNIRNNILMKFAPDLINKLKLSRFHKNLGFEEI
jgi:hypothetical protein